MIDDITIGDEVVVFDRPIVEQTQPLTGVGLDDFNYDNRNRTAFIIEIGLE